MKRVFITQPTYLPWLGIFRAIDWADEFVWYDDVQYERKSWQNRNRIRNVNGGEITLTVPVKKQPRSTLIKDIEISEPFFYQKHLKSIELNYAGEPNTTSIVSYLKDILRMSTRSEKLVAVTEVLTQGIASYLGLKTHFSRSSDYHIEGDKYTRPIAFAKHLGATDYLTQMGTKEYITQEAFGDIKLHWLDLKPPNYLSIVDYLCRLSPEHIRKLLHDL